MDVAQHVNTILDQMVVSNSTEKDFNSIVYINKIFPNEQSLSNIDEVLKILKEKISSLDQEIRSVICSQKNVEENGRKTLEDARDLILKLSNIIVEIKSQAKQSEKIVSEITCNIKQLDNAKRNLTLSIIMLNNLHILVQGTSILRESTKNQQYGTAARTLQGILDVLKQFERFKHIPHISKLIGEIESSCSKLGQQILNDFHDTFDVKNVGTALTQSQIRLLAEGCLVLSILESKYKKELLTWFVESELCEYKALFQDNQDIAWLDKIDKRFSWLKNHLIAFEEKIGFLFPPSWEVSECIAVEFCKITRKELVKVMNNRFIELDVNILLPAISKTAEFEKLLSRRFSGVTLKVGIDKSVNKKNSNPFSGLITVCFENYLNIYVEAQDKNFEKLVAQFVEEHNKMKGQEQEKAEIFASSGKLFTQYKNCLIQCILLSNRLPLVLLSNTFQKYLREYAHKILQNNIPRVGSNISLATLSSTIATSGGGGGVLSAATSAAGLIQIFLKDLENKSYSISEIIQVCNIILTSNYCLETSQQLEKKIQEKIDSSLVNKISMNSECDIFHGIVLNCFQLLIHSIEYSCAQPLTTMIKIPWSTVETPIGPSAYISSLMSIFYQLFPVIRDNLMEIPNHFYSFCNKFAMTFISKYISNIFKCKPLSQGGAEQLLLDSHTLKKALLELPEHKLNKINSASQSVRQSYINTVVNGMSKAEMILKIVLVPSNPSEMFVENYFKLFQDKDIVEFQKILELKGIKKSESLVLQDLFRKRLTYLSKSLTTNSNQNEIDSGESTSKENAVEGIDSNRIKKLEKLIKKRL